MEWLDIKIWLEHTTGFDRDALHIYGAVVIQFCVALFFRRSLASPWPWVAVFVTAIANEYVDYQRAGDTEVSKAIFKAEGYKDMWNTMIIPTALLLIARYLPGWMIGRSDRTDIYKASNSQTENRV